MADKKLSIDSVTAFVAELPPMNMAEVIAEKFEGRVTRRTLCAAQRIVQKKKTKKVPRNILRQLWRLTGGWKNTECLQQAFGKIDSGKFSVLYFGDAEFLIKGDLYAWIAYRGVPLIKLRRNWQDENKLKALISALPKKELKQTA